MTGRYCSKSGRTEASSVSTKISTVRGPMTLFSWDIYISSLAGLCSLSWSFLLVIASFELSKLPLTHLSCLIANSKWDWVIPRAFAWVITSSGTWRSLWLWISCFSWWLPPPRWLWAAELWQELVIVLGHLPVIVRGSYAFLGGAPKATPVDCSCHWATSLVGWFLQCPSVWMRFVQHLLATEPPSVGRHNRD
jgi:hypothetical protein